MEKLIVLSNGAPIAALLLAAIVAISLVGLLAWPAMIERNLFRPHWLLPQREYSTLLTSAFIHADLAHLLFNAFTFWAFASGVTGRDHAAGYGRANFRDGFDRRVAANAFIG